ncbi:MULTISPECIES: glycosyltransferase [Paenarthrobacter]|jgi:glycosyltransferase involved in cell wall biosynthesis|uniref:glycosyltransferase n=1 Tax=Paenarthrobacter TaxID=1742992 RepID=UPI00187845D8|nr:MULTISPECIES: glycosyltransferase family A protein [Paenarthrobacter]MCW3765906.1 glycosyltransferase family 2 protein [Paenarthrobacter sp. PAE-2]QOT16241.1 glycosyltransferase family 2 protein [Paenarthrobacter sp. YJN-5]UOD80219.1 glycosyltransferase family 2 protein [Paenarthrobacter ureafaciens]WNZ04435.1 glycosyltransferase family A protein [Paenarthrobacter ureafaciens]
MNHSSAGAGAGLHSDSATRPLCIAVPMLNEEKLVRQALDSLAAQDYQDFTVVVVDNGSTDASCAIVEAFASEHPVMDIRLIHETEKGTGAAADTGMRFGVEHGATWLARTDADCLAAKDWTARIMAAFHDGLELIAGQLIPRQDEGITARDRRLMLVAVEVASFFGKIRPGNKGEGYLGPYQMLPGCNMAITADMYHRSGGFPRTRIEDLHEDRALSNRVRKLTRNYGLRRDVVVYGSSRRVKAWGLKNTLAWYADHRYRPEHVDIR